MKILFQGDSITDCGRVKESELDVGKGYPHLLKSELGFSAPGKYEFINKGINGNRIVDIYARIRNELINLKPDVLSILVGVNDVWHDFRANPNGVAADKYYKIYDMLIEEIKAELPDIKIIIQQDEKVNRNRHYHMQATVAVFLWIFYVVLNQKQLNVILL